jgi:WD40 repeat protein
VGFLSCLLLGLYRGMQQSQDEERRKALLHRRQRLLQVRNIPLSAAERRAFDPSLARHLQLRAVLDATDERFSSLDRRRRRLDRKRQRRQQRSRSAESGSSSRSSGSSESASGSVSPSSEAWSDYDDDLPPGLVSSSESDSGEYDNDPWVWEAPRRPSLSIPSSSSSSSEEGGEALSSYPSHFVVQESQVRNRSEDAGPASNDPPRFLPQSSYPSHFVVQESQVRNRTEDPPEPRDHTPRLGIPDNPFVNMNVPRRGLAERPARRRAPARRPRRPQSATTRAASMSLFALEVDPSGMRVASAIGCGFRVWDALSLRPLATVDDAHEEIVTAMCWSGLRLVTASLDKSVRIFDCSREDCMCASSSLTAPCAYENAATFAENKDWIRSVCVSPSANTLASGSVSGRVVAWDMTTRDVSFEVIAHETPAGGLNAITGLEFAHMSDSVFASGARDGLVRLWDARAAMRSPSAQILAHSDKLNSLAWSADNRFILSGGRDGAVRLHDLRRLSGRLFDGFGSLSPGPIPVPVPVPVSVEVPAPTPTLILPGDGINKTAAEPPRRRQRRGAALLQRSFSGSGSGGGGGVGGGAGQAAVMRTKKTVLSESPPPEEQPPLDTSCLREFRAHQSGSFNVRCCFAAGDRCVVTGSEDGFAFVYDAASGDVIRVLAGTRGSEQAARPSSSHGDNNDAGAVHLVASNDYTGNLYTSTLADSSVRVWAPFLTNSAGDQPSLPDRSDSSKELHASSEAAFLTDLPTTASSSSSSSSSSLLGGVWPPRSGTAFSSLPVTGDSAGNNNNTASVFGHAAMYPQLHAFMRENGDAILALFHKFNFTIADNMDWRSLALRVMSAPREDPSNPNQPEPYSTERERQLIVRVIEISSAIASAHAATVAERDRRPQGGPNS